MFYNTIAMTVIALLPPAMLCAQVEPPARPASGTPPAAARPDSTKPDTKVQGGTAESDAILATFLLATNSNEIALARIAEQRAQNAEVKTFAKKMIDEHGQFGQKLQPFAGLVAKDGSGGKGESGKNKGDQGKSDGSVAQGQPKDASGDRKASPTGAFDHASLIRDLGKKCLESETKMLSAKSGTEFDRCYMQMQVGAHVKVADMLEVFGTYASERLRPTLDAGHKTVLAHLEHAKALCKQTEKGDKVGKVGGHDDR